MFSSKMKITMKKVYIMFVSLRIPAGNKCPLDGVTRESAKGSVYKVVRS